MKKTAIRLFMTSFTMLIISGCSFSNDSLFPSMSSNTNKNNTIISEPKSEAVSHSVNDANMPNLSSTVFAPLQIAQGENTGTFVGQKVISFRSELVNLQSAIRKHNDDLQRIRNSVNGNATYYRSSINSIEKKLQTGTTPGNPHVVATLQSAQSNLQVMNENAIATNQLSTRVVSDVVMTSFIINSIKTAYSVSGAVDEDHQQLKILQNEAEQTSITLNNISNEINNDYARQRQYIDTANNTLSSLEDPVRRGNLNSYNRSTPVNIAPIGVSAGANNFVGRNNSVLPNTVSSQDNFSNRPLIAIKFNKDNVDYKDGLNRAIKGALQAKSGMEFDIVAVSPASASQAVRTVARNHATNVFQNIVEAGVSPENVSLSAKSLTTANSPEVHIYIK